MRGESQPSPLRAAGTRGGHREQKRWQGGPGRDAGQRVPRVDQVQECGSPFYRAVDGPGRGLEKTGLELGDAGESQGEAAQDKECHGSTTRCSLFVALWLLPSGSEDAKDDVGPTGL